ncbi:MAG: preprotein translocase subunit YajC [Planctomycetes bacterium]|nr:preprotein translocase subunit YajC [Planctomycetota bacterium]
MSIYAFLALLQDPIQGAAPSGAPGSAPGAAPGATGPAAQSGPPFSWIGLLPYVAIIAIFYFVMIMPERKARKKREAMLSAMKKGDKVMTSGGMFAVIAAINGDEITLQIDEGVRARFSRNAITQVVVDGAGDDAKK